MRRSRRLGFTMVEVLIAGVITLLIIVGSISVYLTALLCSASGYSHSDAYQGVAVSAGWIDSYVSQSMSATILNSGNTLQLQMPQANADGSPINPPVAQTVPAQMYLSNGNLYWSDAAMSGTVGRNPRILATGVTLTNPSTNQSVTLFSPGSGQVVRSIKVQFWVKASNGYAPYTSFIRLRNMQSPPL